MGLVHNFDNDGWSREHFVLYRCRLLKTLKRKTLEFLIRRAIFIQVQFWAIKYHLHSNWFWNEND